MFQNQVLRNTHMCKIVVVDFHPSLCRQLSKVVHGANEEIIAHDIAHHLLIQITIVDVFPFGILEENSIFIWSVEKK